MEIDTTTYFGSYSAEQRRQMAKDGEALPDGSFPIKTRSDVESAVHVWGVYQGDKAKAKAFIIKRAKALGAMDLIPDTWKKANMAGEALTTISDVEILKVGNWHSGLSGEVPITADDIDAIVAAATDPEVDAAPLKVGHVDPRFDGEPALGWVKNLRNRGGVLVGDIVDAPAKMADVLRGAFRRRSAEIAWGVKTPSGNAHKAALTGLALLGVQVPAVKGLADVMAMYSAPEAESTDRVVVIDEESGPRAARLADAISAAAGYAATLDGDPSQARAFAALQLLSGGSDNSAPVSVDNRPNDSSQEGSVNDDQVREALGLTADTPVTDQFRKIAADAEAARLAAEASPPAPAAPVGGPTTVVDAAALAALQAQAQAGQEALRRLDAQDREQELAAALSGGKIAPANIDLWRAQWDKDREGTRALLAGLPQVFSTVTTFSGQPNGATGAVAPSVGADGIPEETWDAFQTDFASYMSKGK